TMPLGEIRPQALVAVLAALVAGGSIFVAAEDTQNTVYYGCLIGSTLWQVRISPPRFCGPAGFAQVIKWSEVGPPGPSGATGATGPIGLAGPAGECGPEGPIGLIGSTGPEGATGASGPQGLPGSGGASPFRSLRLPSRWCYTENSMTFSGTTRTMNRVVSGSGGGS
ncbi:MAG: hypothetical protein WBW04_02560, partial [Nitrolancea sp.]